MKRQLMISFAACLAAVLPATAIAAEAEAATVASGPQAAIEAPRAVESKLMGLCHAGDTLVAVGNHGDILIGTTPRTWKQVPSPVDIMLTRCAFADAEHGWAVGHNSSILHSSDGGQHWQVQHYEVEGGKPLMSVLALDAQHVIAIGAFGLMLRSADAGKTWVASPTDMFGAVTPHLNDIIRLADGRLVLVGERGTVMLSADAGNSWTMLKATPFDGSYFGVIPWGAEGIMVFGIGGNTYMVNDVDSVLPAATPMQAPAPAGASQQATTAAPTAGKAGAGSKTATAAAAESEPEPAPGNWVQIQDGGGESLFAGLQTEDQHAVLVGISGEVIGVGPNLATMSIPVSQFLRVVAEDVTETKEHFIAGSVKSFTGIALFDGKLVLVGESGLVTISPN